MGGPVTDVHVHIQPQAMIKPAVLEAFRRGSRDHQAAEPCFDDSQALLRYMDDAGVARIKHGDPIYTDDVGCDFPDLFP